MLLRLRSMRPCQDSQCGLISRKLLRRCCLAGLTRLPRSGEVWDGGAVGWRVACEVVARGCLWRSGEIRGGFLPPNLVQVFALLDSEGARQSHGIASFDMSCPLSAKGREATLHLPCLSRRDTAAPCSTCVARCHNREPRRHARTRHATTYAHAALLQTRYKRACRAVVDALPHMLSMHTSLCCTRRVAASAADARTAPLQDPGASASKEQPPAMRAYVAQHIPVNRQDMTCSCYARAIPLLVNLLMSSSRARTHVTITNKLCL